MVSRALRTISRWRKNNLRTRSILIYATCAGIFLSYLKFRNRMRFQVVDGNLSTSLAEDESFLGNQECRLPNLDPYNPEIAHFFHHPNPQKCGTEENWVYHHKGQIYTSGKAQRIHGKISCKFSEFSRQSDEELLQDPYVNFENGTKVPGNFFEVSCSAEDGSIFENVYSTVFPSPEAISRAKNAANQDSDAVLGVNVYIWALESMSRMNVIRKLPKTYRFIKSLEPAILEGYNIVGDGTPQALIPILTGKTEVELPLTRKRFSEANFVDVYPWIWNSFRDAGYVTLFGEDTADVGAFNYRLKGFYKQPTDHYMRTFYLKAEEKYMVSHMGREWWRFFKNNFCIRGESEHKVFFRNSEDFFQNYPAEVRKFAFMFYGSMISHEDVNNIEMADEELKEHLEFMKNAGFLDNTVLILMSDHGHRFDKLRQTYQGQLEERMPFFAVVAPHWFRKKYEVAWKNLVKNSKRLTSPFDVHETLKMLLNWREPRKADRNQRGMSLFDEIPSDRSCKEAGIDSHWCICLQWSEISTNDYITGKIAEGVVSRINAETERERKLCSLLTLDRIENAKRLVPKSELTKYRGVLDKDGYVPDLSGDVEVSFALYQVKFRTVPGNAVYEATVKFDARTNPAKIFVDLNTVSHINRYGDMPDCVIKKDYFLAKWCVCFDKINKET